MSIEVLSHDGQSTIVTADSPREAVHAWRCARNMVRAGVQLRATAWDKDGVVHHEVSNPFCAYTADNN